MSLRNPGHWLPERRIVLSEELSDIEKARALLAARCLWEMLAAAKQQTDIVNWRKVGGLELEDFADAIDRGGLHPLLQWWQARKSQTNRPAPGLREQNARRLAVLLCNALQRVGIAMGEARKQVAEALGHTGLFVTAPTAGALKHWEERMEHPFTEADERAITAAIASCGRDPQRLIEYFIGLVQFSRNPFVP
jgi:hypothetical protein